MYRRAITHNELRRTCRKNWHLQVLQWKASTQGFGRYRRQEENERLPAHGRDLCARPVAEDGGPFLARELTLLDFRVFVSPAAQDLLLVRAPRIVEKYGRAW